MRRMASTCAREWEVPAAKATQGSVARSRLDGARIPGGSAGYLWRTRTIDREVPRHAHRIASLRAAPGCGRAGLRRSRPTKAPADPDALKILGTAPFTPLPKVEFTLTDTRGRPYDFRKETDGHLTLLYFGYTYCPDVCPLQMSTLSAALPDLDPAVRDSLRVVFVTVDPERDTPERLHEWLSSFDTSFVGLRGTKEEITRALDFYRFPPPEKSGEEEGYTVSHPAYVYAFTPDDRGRGMYGSETTKAVWSHDLALMAGHDWSRARAAAQAEAGEPAPPAPLRPLLSAGDVDVLDAYLPRPAAGDVTALYVTLHNRGHGGRHPGGDLGRRGGPGHPARHEDGRRADEDGAPGGRAGPASRRDGGVEAGWPPRHAGGSEQVVGARHPRRWWCSASPVRAPIAVPARVVRYEDLVR